jgi:hypothetical protein
MDAAELELLSELWPHHPPNSKPTATEELPNDIATPPDTENSEPLAKRAKVDDNKDVDEDEDEDDDLLSYEAFGMLLTEYKNWKRSIAESNPLARWRKELIEACTKAPPWFYTDGSQYYEARYHLAIINRALEAYAWHLDIPGEEERTDFDDSYNCVENSWSLEGQVTGGFERPLPYSQDNGVEYHTNYLHFEIDRVATKEQKKVMWRVVAHVSGKSKFIEKVCLEEVWWRIVFRRQEIALHKQWEARTDAEKAERHKVQTHLRLGF